MAPKRPKRQQPRAAPPQRQAGFSVIDEAIAQRQKAAVIESAAGGKTGAKARELALSAIIWADHLVGLFEAENRLPRPIACQPGCYFCCHNQIELTPPEAILLGDYVEENFSDEEKRQLRDRIEQAIHLKRGKSKKEVAESRQQLPCPCLTGGKCSVYPVRPLVCRAMHALDAGQCAAAFQSQDLRAAEHYSHRQVFARSVVQGLLDGCQAVGCQAGALDLAEALRDFFAQPDPAARWLQGEKVFTRISPFIGGPGRKSVG